MRGAIAFWLLLLSGCDGCQGGTEPVSDHEVATPAARAVIEGHVRLAPGAELPRYFDNPMIAASPRPGIPDFCNPPAERDREPVRRVAGDRLVGVLVAVSEFTGDVPREPATHEVFIRDCRLTPELVVATRGDTLRLVNETNYPFFPDLGQGLMQALLRQQTRDLELGRGGVRTLACGFTAPCGRTQVVTLYHPLHTITDDQGHFRIEGVPSGQEIRLNAWHPLFAETNVAVTARPGETRRVEITLSPARAQAAPTPQSPAPTTPEQAPTPEAEDPSVLF